MFSWPAGKKKTVQEYAFQYPRCQLNLPPISYLGHTEGTKEPDLEVFTIFKSLAYSAKAKVRKITSGSQNYRVGSKHFGKGGGGAILERGKGQTCNSGKGRAGKDVFLVFFF